MLTLTENAVKQLRNLLSGQPENADAGLRLDVELGGCAGFQYVMKLGSPSAGDQTVEQSGVRVFLGERAVQLLANCRLDFVEALNDGGFRVENPDAARSCGCGTSFEPKK